MTWVVVRKMGYHEDATRKTIDQTVVIPENCMLISINPHSGDYAAVFLLADGTLQHVISGDMKHPAWFDFVESLEDTIKSPRNKEFWDEVEFRDSKNSYHGEYIYVQPEFKTMFVDMGAGVWVSMLIKSSHKMPEHIKQEITMWQSLAK